MEIPDHLTCLLRNWYACQDTTVRIRHETMDWFQIGKGVHQGCVLSPCLFNFCAEYIKRNARLDESQAGIKIAGRNIDNLRYADDTTLMAESEVELKSLLMEVKEQSGKTGLKQHSKNEDYGIQSHHFMANSWGNNESSERLIFLGSKSTADGDCSHEIKKTLTPWKKSYDKPRQLIKKQTSLCGQRSAESSYGFSSSHAWM